MDFQIRMRPDQTVSYRCAAVFFHRCAAVFFHRCAAVFLIDRSQGKSRLLLAFLIIFCGLLVSPQEAHAQPQPSKLPFVEGLRERRFFDTAIEYLNELAAKPDLAPDIREVLDLEMGITWQQMGAASRIPEDRNQQLAQAEQYLRKFSAEHSEHPMAAFANSSLGELLFERARTLMWQTDAPENAGRKAELQLQARQLIGDAEAIYQKAHDQYQAQYKAFPTFVDPAKEEEQYQKRLEAESRYLVAWFQLTRCTYERGLTFDPGSKERNETLIKASDLFEKIHTSRRENPIGLHARLMMGKCYQEQDDIGRALGLYNEIISHKSDNPVVDTPRNQAVQFRLMCLNGPQRNDHQVVFNEASAWLEKNKNQLGTQIGQGILWEKTIAEEKLAADRNLTPEQKQVLLRQAMADATVVARYMGPYREPANAMLRRLKATLGDSDKEPRDFDTAFQRARGMVDQIGQLRDAIDSAADAQDRQQKTNSLNLHLNEIERLLRLALDLVENDTDAKAQAQARYLLSFIYYRQRKNFDAVIMSTYCMTKDRGSDPDSALNATEIAIGAAMQAFNDAPAADRSYETALLRDVCLQILQLYPQSAKGNEARIRLGRVYQQLDNPMEAVKWFLEVPESDPMYASARISAGQSFLAAWSRDAIQEQSGAGNSSPTSADLSARRNEAKNLLTQGIQLFRDKLGPDASPVDEVVAAEVSLASIMNLDGEFQATIDRLTAGGDNSVLKAIEVPEGEARPEGGIRSKAFAGQTYRILLRAYVGVQQIDDARRVMDQLESVGSEDITAVYTQLGMELQEELKRLKQSGEAQRLKDVRDSFEKFLQKVYDTRDKSNFNSLLWIGETYFGLGQGVAEEAATAATYYDKAATAYREILSSNLAQEPTATAIRLRLARCLRQQQKFEEAYQITETILKANALALDAQFEAAHILTDWGASGTVDKFLPAIQGVKNDKNELIVWGWSNIARRLQQTLSRDPSPEFRDRFLDARYQLSLVRRRYAAATPPTSEDAKSQLRSAKAEITILTQVVRDIEEPWWGKFDRLYRDIQADLGEQPKPLERFVAATAPAPQPKAPEKQKSNSESAKPEETVAAVEPMSTGSLITIAVVAILIAGGAAVGFYIMLSRPQKKIRSTYATSASVPVSAGMVEISDAPPEMPDFSAIAAAVPDRRKTSPTKVAAKKPASEGAAKPVPKPRPRPPEGGPAQPKPGEAKPAEPRPPQVRPPQPRPAQSRPPESRPVQKPKPPSLPPDGSPTEES